MTGTDLTPKPNMLLTFEFTFLPQKVQKEPIPEEQEMDFRPVEEGEERSDSDSSHNEEAKEPDKANRKEGEKTDRAGAGKAHFVLLNSTYTKTSLNSLTMALCPRS